MNYLSLYIFIKVVHFIDFTVSERVKFSYTIITFLYTSDG